NYSEMRLPSNQPLSRCKLHSLFVLTSCFSFFVDAQRRVKGQQRATQTSIYRRNHRRQDLSQIRHALTVSLERFVSNV
ncbi:hypothetical protein ACU6QH_01340, partial [Aeromonas veronii]|uniref:hypothetical protein n=1 Tax=Aeromonas veronii TaxID=654 RepID=UPI00406C0B45